MFAKRGLALLFYVAVTLLSFGGKAVSGLDEIIIERQRNPPTEDGLSPASSPMTLNSLASRAQLGERSSFRFLNGLIRQSAKGVKRVRLIQTYGGYDVFGTAAEAEMDASENLSGQIFGEVVKDIHKSIKDPEACQRNVKFLQNIAIRLERLRPNDHNVNQRDGRRIIYAGPGKPRLAYRIEFLFMDADRFTRPVYFFDACTGFVLLKYDQVRNATLPEDRRNVTVYNKDLKNSASSITNSVTACAVNAVGVGGNLKISQITYNQEPFCLNVQKSFNLCTMEGTYSKVVDNENSVRQNKQTVARFTCSIGYNDPINGAFGVANDALYYGEISGRFFEDKYNMRALSHKPRLVVHFGFNYENALWDGTDMYFGDGASLFHPLVDLNVVAHELSHGVTTSNSDLVYIGMSGGINEAFSDITAETTEFYLTNEIDWLVGYNVIKQSASIEALRYFEDPTKDGVSIGHVLQYRPLMDVHFSSGLFNRAFYIMVEDENMDIFEAYKCFLDANLNLWRPFTNFYSGACNVMQAAYDNGFNHRKIRRAFWRVGIPLIFCNYAALTSAMFNGETRDDILVSASRSPIIKVELDKKLTDSAIISAVAEDQSNVHLVVGKDDLAVKVIAKGDNSVSISSSIDQVYVKLSSKSPKDIRVRLEVKQ